MKTLYKTLKMLKKMNRFKNIAKLIICGFALVGLTACGSSGGGGGSTSNNGGTDGLTLTSANSIITDNKIDSTAAITSPLY